MNAPLKLPKLKKCKVCRTQFQPLSTTQQVCSPACAIKHVEAVKAKKARIEYRDAKEKMKGWQEWFDECKQLAQKYARLRDRNDGCISCDKPPNWHGQWHGSHFRPAGNFKAVALNLLNIHKACSECNNFKSGNGVEYQDRLIVKIGQDKVDWLKSQNQPVRHSIDYLKRYKKVMAKKCRRLERKINHG